MVKVRGRLKSINIEDRRPGKIKSSYEGLPLSVRFQKKQNWTVPKSPSAPKKNSKGRSGERPKVGTLGTRGRRVTYAPGKVRSMSGGGYR